MELKFCEECVDYFSMLSREKNQYTIIICSRDNIGSNLSEELADSVLSLGLKSDLHRARGLGGKSHRTFIAIVDGGAVVVELLGERHQNAETYSEGAYEIKSTVFHDGSCDDAKILVDGVDYCTNARGLNIVVVEREGGKVVDSICIDAYGDECKFIRMVNVEAIRNYLFFKENYKAEKLPNLALYHPRYPYGEIAVVIGEVAERLMPLCERENMHLTQMGGNTVLSMIQPHTDINGITYIFSGMTRCRDRLVFGIDDIGLNSIAASELRECIGEFELLIYDGARLELSTDFFGLCQWYYYKSDDGFAAASSYHLLLLTLKEMGVKLQLDVPKVSAGMGFFGAVSEQSFTEHMDIENCYEILPDHRIIVDVNNKVHFEKTGLFHEVFAPEQYSEEAYEKSLFEIRDEIIDNVRIAFEHPHFNHVLCDLSGGLDSRVVFAAAQNLPQRHVDKLRINTNPGMSADYRIANAIINAYGTKLDDIPRTESYENIGVYDGEMRQARQSHNLGTSYVSDYTPSAYTSKNAIRLMGGYGEVLYRTFFSWIDDSKKKEDICNYISSAVDVKRSTKSMQHFQEYVRESLSYFPNMTLKKQIELYFMYYSAKHHFRTKYRQSTAVWLPLQSKKAFHLQMMYFSNTIDDKMQHDIMSLLNPLLANFPYESDKHNRNVNDLAERLYRKGLPKVEVTPCYDSVSHEKKHLDIEYVPDRQTVLDARKTTLEWYRDEKTLLSALKAFLDYSDEFEELGLPLYLHFTSDRYTKQYAYHDHVENVRINRILSAYWQIALANG